MTKASRIACIILVLVSGTMMSGCDLITESSKSALSSIATAALESVGLTLISGVLPELTLDGPRLRIGLFPPGNG